MPLLDGLPTVEEVLANSIWPLAHAAIPNMLLETDWKYGTLLNQGNYPPDGWTAFADWAQIFHVNGVVSANYIQVRNLKCFICHGPDRRWILYQKGLIQGNEYLTDWVNNTHQSPAHYVATGDIVETSLSTDYAFHFWDINGKSLLPPNIHGILVCFEHRAVQSGSEGVTPNAFLTGTGFDYWAYPSAVWAPNGAVNKSAFIGQLNYVTGNWQWSVSTTAPIEDILRLYRNGYS